MKRSAFSSTQIFDYQERYIDVLYYRGLHGRIFMKIKLLMNPLNETHLAMVSGVIHCDVSPESINKESSTECHSYNHLVNRSP